MTVATHDRSRLMLDRAADVIPGGINTAKRKIDPPLCMSRASGGWFEDLDGARYLDYHCAYSAILLGHAEPGVNRAVAGALDAGTLYGVGVTGDEVRLAEKIVEHVPSVEQVLLCNTGSEATYHVAPQRGRRRPDARTGRRVAARGARCAAPIDRLTHGRRGVTSTTWIPAQP